RPQTFEEVTGQEPITRTLRGALEHERLHHAYLFSGARGVGKTTTARLLAKALNCHKSDRPTATPCKTTDADQCPSCREIAEGRSIDVLEIDAASNTGVDNVREAIINTVAVSPARDRYKVFIIDEVHMLSGAAFNALLKTLEEPPPRVVFIMATTESHKIPDTILSRSQQFEFRTIATQKIAERLRHIADAEKIKVKDDALREIARAGEGSMRDAQSAFDQVISFSDGEIKTADVETALGIAGAELRSRVMRSIAEAVPKDALAVVDDLVMRGHDLRNFCRDLLSHVRDLLVVKVAGDAADAVDASDAERRELAREAGEFSESDLVRFFHSLTETERSLREGAHPRYQLEIGLVKLIEMRRLAPVGQILERLGALEEALRTGKSPATSAGAMTPQGGAGGGSNAPRGGQASGGGGRGVPPVSRASASPTEGVARELPTPPALPTPQPGNPQWFNTSAAQTNVPAANAPTAPNAATVINAPVNTPTSSSPADVPPWEEPPWDDSYSLTSPPALTLVPPAPQGNGQTQPTQGASPANRAAAASAPAKLAAAAPGSLVEQIKTGLEERRKPFLAIALESARKVEVDGDSVHVEFAPGDKHLRENLLKPDNFKLLREVCRAVCGREMSVHVGVKDKSEGKASPPGAGVADDDEKRRLREMAESHPAVQEMLRTFRAEIVDVRRVDGTTEQ
ncbi:MAG TPA: DNA polymerase III subunit gamma/tau, partial [Pyrinomonadaceae bacterium]|nr:DNA polymerase III subunit gamma/tau [Pyrinomonadaceae bacterium]